MRPMAYLEVLASLVFPYEMVALGDGCSIEHEEGRGDGIIHCRGMSKRRMMLLTT